MDRARPWHDEGQDVLLIDGQDTHGQSSNYRPIAVHLFSTRSGLKGNCKIFKWNIVKPHKKKLFSLNGTAFTPPPFLNGTAIKKKLGGGLF